MHKKHNISGLDDNYHCGNGTLIDRSRPDEFNKTIDTKRDDWYEETVAGVGKTATNQTATEQTINPNQSIKT